METNLIFAGIGVIFALWMIRSSYRGSRLRKIQDTEKVARMETWHQENPGYRWAEARSTTAAGKLSDGPSWFSVHGPTE